MMRRPSPSPAPPPPSSLAPCDRNPPLRPPHQRPQHASSAIPPRSQTVQPPTASTSSPTTQTLATPDQIETALSVLHSGDARLAQANTFLTQVASAPTAWPLLSNLIRSSTTSAAALRFAANTLLSRLRADWLSFPDLSARHEAVSLAITAAAQAPLNGPLHALGTACGFALALCESGLQREACWNAITQSQITTHSTRHCLVFAAVAQEARRVANTAPIHSFRIDLEQFLAAHVAPVLTPALTILHNNNIADVVELRAAVACVSAWRWYAEPSSIGVIASGLAHAIATPTAASDAAEALAEVVGYSATPPGLIAAVCRSLLETHSGCDAVEVRHAIAEVACAISDGNADDLMDQETYTSNADVRLAIAAETQLLAATLSDDSDYKPFFAALDGWGNWVAASTVGGRVILSNHQIAAVVSRVVSRVADLPVVTALAPLPSPLNSSASASYDMEGDWEDFSEYASEVGSIRDILYAACTAVGMPKFLEAASSQVLSVTGVQGSRDTLIASCLFSVLVAGDVHVEREDMSALESVLRAVVQLLQQCTTPEIRRLGFACLCAHMQSVLTCAQLTPFVDDVVRLAATEVHSMPASVSCNRNANGRVQAAQLLELVAEKIPARLIQLLPELVASSSSITSWNSAGPAAQYFSHALGLAVGTLSSTDARCETVWAIVAVPCEQIEGLWRQWGIGNNQEVHAQKQHLCKWLDVVSAVLRGVNDDRVGAQIFSRIKQAVGDISLKCASNAMIARSVCRFIEVCALPTLVDDENERTDVMGGSAKADTTQLTQQQSGKDKTQTQSTGTHTGVRHQQQSQQDTHSTPRRRRRPPNSESEIGSVDKGADVTLRCIALATQCFERSGPSGEICWIRSMREMCVHLAPGDAFSHGYSIDSTLRAVSAFCEGDLFSQPDLISAALSLAATVAPPLHVDATIMATRVLSTNSLGSNSNESDMYCQNPNLCRAALGVLAKVGMDHVIAVGGAHVIAEAVLITPLKTRTLAAVAADVLFNLSTLSTPHCANPGAAINSNVSGPFPNNLSSLPVGSNQTSTPEATLPPIPIATTIANNCATNSTTATLTTTGSPPVTVTLTKNMATPSENGYGINLASVMAKAFSNQRVPRSSLDPQVKQALFSRCVAAVGSKTELRKALEHLSRACYMRSR